MCVIMLRIIVKTPDPHDLLYMRPFIFNTLEDSHAQKVSWVD